MLPIDLNCLSTTVIHAKASSLGLAVTDAEQFKFLQRIDTFDLQAAPGCGKTTLTALKLCLLASGWKAYTRGVCVLSHTNVAKNQIIEILRRDQDGSQFLKYPNFIGTIQTFVDTHLAFPNLRSKGIEIRVIDPDAYARSAMYQVNNGAYPKLQGLTGRHSRRQDIQPLIETARYSWADGCFSIFGTANNRDSSFPFKPEAASAIEFKALKEQLTGKGIFGYEDMYAFASQYLDLNPSVGEALRWRFPFVLIDEMQDTDRMQDELLRKIFAHRDCYLQRIGDVNQRIFSLSEPSLQVNSSFPETGYDDLPKSKRFGESIASISSRLTSLSPQRLQGNPNRPDIPPALILFEEESVSDVLPTFARLVKAHLDTSNLPEGSIKAVCARKASTSNKFPSHIATYWPRYSPSALRSGRPTRLFLAIQEIRLSPELAWHQRFDILLEGCCEILIRWGWKLSGRRPRPGSFRSFMLKAEKEDSLRVRRALLKLMSVDPTNQATWEESVQVLLGSLAKVCALHEPTERVKLYCLYEGGVNENAEKEVVCTSASFDIGGETVTVELSTVHASKGETHAATLVLESFNGTHDLKEVLPILVDKHSLKRIGETKSIQAAMRTVFVGMTRPQFFLGFAVRKSHVQPLIEEFISQGWEVHDLC